MKSISKIKVEDIAEDGIVFYDIETDGLYAPYCKLRMIGYQLGVNGEPQLVDPTSEESMEAFRELVGSNIIKVGFNNINFDDVVLWQHGFFVNPENRHDMYLAMKTYHPTFPSYSLKFINWWIDANQTPREAYHYWEGDMLGEMQRSYLEMHHAPIEKLGPYCMHDVRETANVFRAVWEKVQEEKPFDHWRAYTELEIAMGESLHEMMLIGRELIDLDDIRKRIVEHKKKRELWMDRGVEWSGGLIKNVGSVKQVTHFLSKYFGIKFEVSELGNLLGRKSDWLRIIEAIIRIIQTRRNADGGIGQGQFSQAIQESDGSIIDYIREHIEEQKTEIKIAFCIYEVHDLTKVIGYLRSYLYAGIYERRRQRTSTNSQGTNSGFHAVHPTISFDEKRIQRSKRNKVQGNNSQDSSIVWIPKSYGLSTARTRRFRSSSRFSYVLNGKEIKFGINWQNQNKRSKIVQLVPRGWLGFWLDSTQIENVVHIWASDDDDRRTAYEADPDWNEYVWLSNMVLGTDLTREQLDKKNSEVNPEWSVYKQYKTIKLALNFGMGPDKFSKTTNLKIKLAVKEFAKVHRACPAIRRLQGIVREALVADKCVEDPFGHIYSGNKEDAYKVVAYLVQGCGTGSVPKAMTVANFNTLHEDDTNKPIHSPYVRHPYTGKYSYGVLCGTTHDECAGRISLGLPTERIVKIVRDLLKNMEEKFSPMFDNIPLRAKLAVSITNAADQKELDHRKDNFEEKLLAYIKRGKENGTDIVSDRS